MMWGYGLSWGGMLLSSVIWIALLAVFAWAIIRWVNGKMANTTPLTTSTPSGPSALEIVRQRYARGEIDAATFEQMRERLESSHAPGYQQSESNQPLKSNR
jgi:putative membrane protein